MEATPSPDKWAHLEQKAAAIMRAFERAHAEANRTAADLTQADEQLNRLNDEAEAIAVRPLYDEEANREARGAVGYAAAVFLDARRLHKIAREGLARARTNRDALDPHDPANRASR